VRGDLVPSIRRGAPAAGNLLSAAVSWRAALEASEAVASASLRSAFAEGLYAAADQEFRSISARRGTAVSADRPA
jgi:hypothetical protein